MSSVFSGPCYVLLGCLMLVLLIVLIVGRQQNIYMSCHPACRLEQVLLSTAYLRYTMATIAILVHDVEHDELFSMQLGAADPVSKLAATIANNIGTITVLGAIFLTPHTVF